jgi:hypothetical protein
MEKSAGITATSSAQVVILEIRPQSNYDAWIRYVVNVVVLPLTDRQTGTAIKKFVEKNEDPSTYGRMTFESYLSRVDFESDYPRKKGAEAARLPRRASGFVDRQNIIETEAPDVAEEKQDKPDEEPKEETSSMSLLEFVLKTYKIDDKEIAKLRDKKNELNEQTLMEQRRAFAWIMPTIGKSSIDEASVDKDKWEKITTTQNPFELVEYMKVIHNKERGAVYEKKHREFLDIRQSSGERVAGFVVRIDEGADAVNLVAGTDKKVTTKDKAHRLVHGADVSMFDDLFKKYHQVKTENLPTYTALVQEYSSNEDAVEEIKNRKSEGPSGVAKGLVSTYAQATGGGSAAPNKAANVKEGKGKRCFTCERYSNDEKVGYDHLKGDKNCPSKAAWEQAKKKQADQQGNKKGGNNSSKNAGGKMKCQVCALFKEPQDKVNTHIFSEVCPHYARIQAPPKAKMAMHVNYDHIADTPEDTVEAFMSQEIVEDPQVLKIATSLLKGSR